MSWLQSLRSASTVAAAALVTFVAIGIASSAGCNKGAVPSGSESAANGVRQGASDLPHLVGFNVDECVPGLAALFPSTAGKVWFFVTTNKTGTAGAAMSNINVLVNGVVQGAGVAQVRALGAGSRSFWIFFNKLLQQGQQVQIDATVNGVAKLSNAVVVPTSGLSVGNTPPGFVLGALPVHQLVAPRPVVMEFTHAVPPGLASSYLSLTITLIFDQQGNLVGFTVGQTAELAQTGSYTMGSATNLLANFLNPANLATGTYLLNIIALDGNGFGIGTSSDGDFQTGTWRIFG